MSEQSTTDTANVRDMTQTLADMVAPMLIRLGGAVDLLLQADALFKEGKDEDGKRYVNNAAAAVGDTSIQMLLYQALPRTGEPSGGMG